MFQTASSAVPACSVPFHSRGRRVRALFPSPSLLLPHCASFVCPPLSSLEDKYEVLLSVWFALYLKPATLSLYRRALALTPSIMCVQS